MQKPVPIPLESNNLPFGLSNLPISLNSPKILVVDLHLKQVKSWLVREERDNKALLLRATSATKVFALQA